MEREWALGRLQNWLNLAEAYGDVRGGYTTWSEEREAAAAALVAASPQVEQIVRARYSKASPIATPNGYGWWSISTTNDITIVKRTMAVLETEQETAAHMGPAGPSLQAASLHPTIWNAAASLWDSGHRTDSVKRAATFLNAHIADLVDRHDVSDSALMREAFSSNPPTEGKPRLRWRGDPTADLSVKAMRDGLLNYSQGVFLGIRNVTTHLAGDLDPQVALEQLAALSLLARWIDECEVDRA